jgi:cell division protein FtsZ
MFIDITNWMQIPGLVNVDFADVRSIMANAGSSLMGIGTATGMYGNWKWFNAA